MHNLEFRHFSMTESITHNIGIGLGMVERHPFRIVNSNGAWISISNTIVSHEKNCKAVSECSQRIEIKVFKHIFNPYFFGL